jgi:hypothetical protein
VSHAVVDVELPDHRGSSGGLRVRENDQSTDNRWRFSSQPVPLESNEAPLESIQAIHNK